MRLAPAPWAEEAPAGAWPDLDRDARCEVLVIGAGIAGLAITSELAARGADVLCVDASGPGSGASARNAGFLLVTHAWGYPALRDRIGAAEARATIAIARRSHARIESDHGAAVLHRRGGTSMLANDPEEWAALERAAALLRADGVRCEEAEPPPATRGFPRALAIPEDGEVHPGRLIRALAAQVRRGATARIDAIDPIARSARAGGLSIAFDHAIVASNAWAPRLVPELGAIVTPHRAQVLMTAPLPRAIPRPCYATRGFDYFRQRDDGRIVLGGRRHLHREAEATEEDHVTDALQRDLERFLAVHLPFAAGAAIERRWAGTMAFTPDHLPLIGALPRAPEAVSLLVGWNGHGLGLAIGAAELLAAALSGKGSPLPRCFDPARLLA